jgi:hypothetical protein
MVMQEGGRWRAVVERVPRLRPGSRRVSSARRGRSKWQSCRRCPSRSYLRIGGDLLCSGCRSLQ